MAVVRDMTENSSAPPPHEPAMEDALATMIRDISLATFGSRESAVNTVQVAVPAATAAPPSELTAIVTAQPALATTVQDQWDCLEKHLARFSQAVSTVRVDFATASESHYELAAKVATLATLIQDVADMVQELGAEVGRMAGASAASFESGESASTVVPPSTILQAPGESNGVLLQEFVLICYIFV